ncbi:hypothetical protein WP50_18305 [Lactiplantibacillus plantarum]|nr:hypothetical protein WP50_18305 [Lactiplantibacillus plantarum]
MTNRKRYPNALMHSDGAYDSSSAGSHFFSNDIIQNFRGCCHSECINHSATTKILNDVVAEKVTSS